MTNGIEHYYQRYWSEEGFSPAGRCSGVIAPLLGANVLPGTRCLDVGCGDGTTTGLWAQRVGADYLGVDISSGAVARTRALGLAAELVDDASRLPLESGSFDVAVCSEVLEHLFDPLAALAELRRVLRPDGRLIITVPNIAYWRRRADLLVGRWHPGGDTLAVEQPWRDPHIRFFTVAAMGRFLRTARFETLELGARSDITVLRELPGLRGLARTREPRRRYRRLEARAPGLLGSRIYALARRPA